MDGAPPPPRSRNLCSRRRTNHLRHPRRLTARLPPGLRIPRVRPSTLPQHRPRRRNEPGARHEQTSRRRGRCAVRRAWRSTPPRRRRRRKRPSASCRPRPVVVQPDQKVEASSQRAMENYRRFLELQKTDPQLRAEALRRLGDLNMEAGEGDRMAGEASIDRRAGRRGHQAVHQPAQELSRLSAQRPGALPAGARLRDHRPAREGAGHARRRPARVIRKSPQMDEVQFRRGELLFSAKQYRPAQDAYGYVVTKGDKAPFLTQSLYKHGWSLFKQGLNDDSLPSFAGVLDRTMLTKTTRKLMPLEKLPRANRELADDTLRVMAVTFSYDDDSVGRHREVPRRATTTRPTRPSSIRVSATCTSRRNASRMPPRCTAPSPRANRTASSRRAFRSRPSRPTARAASPQLVLEGKREYVALYNYGTSVLAGPQQGRLPEHRQGTEAQPQGRRDLLPRQRAEVEEAGRVPRGGALVPHLSRILPGRSGFLRHELSTVRDAVRGEGLPGRGRRVRRRPRTTTRAIRVRPRRPMRRWARSRSTKRACRPPRRPRRTRRPWMRA